MAASTALLRYAVECRYLRHEGNTTIFDCGYWFHLMWHPSVLLNVSNFLYQKYFLS